MTAGMDPAPFATGPEQVAEAVAQALRDNRQVVYVPSVLRLVMSGVRHLPRAAMRRLDM